MIHYIMSARTIALLVILTTCPVLGTAQELDPRIKTKKQVVAEKIAAVAQIGVETLKKKMERKEPLVLLDVRTERERNAGFISSSIWIPRGVLEFKIQSVCKNADTEIVVYCRKGGRSVLAAKTLQEMGYTHVFNLTGGVNAWGEKGYSLYNWHGEIKVIRFDQEDPLLSSFDIFLKQDSTK